MNKRTDKRGRGPQGQTAAGSNGATTLGEVPSDPKAAAAAAENVKTKIDQLGAFTEASLLEGFRRHGFPVGPNGEIDAAVAQVGILALVAVICRFCSGGIDPEFVRRTFDARLGVPASEMRRRLGSKAIELARKFESDEASSDKLQAFVTGMREIATQVDVLDGISEYEAPKPEESGQEPRDLSNACNARNPRMGWTCTKPDKHDPPHTDLDEEEAGRPSSW